MKTNGFPLASTKLTIVRSNWVVEKDGVSEVLQLFKAIEQARDDKCYTQITKKEREGLKGKSKQDSNQR